MFISKCNLCNYAHDNTLYSTGKDLNRIKRNFEMNFRILDQWFTPMVIGSKELSHKIMLINNEITTSNEEKLLSKLIFESHIGSLCRKADQKINARLKNYLTSDQRNLLLNSVIKSQFTYCPLIWMFMSRYLNNVLNNVHERALRLIYWYSAIDLDSRELVVS